MSNGSNKQNVVIGFRLSKNESYEFEQLMVSMKTNKSAFLRKKVRKILKSITKDQ